MKTSRILAVVLAGLLAMPGLAAAQQRPAPGEVIDAVAQYTGLTNDAVSLVLKDNAAALGRLTDAVLAAQIAQRFLDARDAEIAADVFAAATDTAAEALLPPPLMTAIKAMRVYKSVLVLVRDKVLIPSLDRQLYAKYRAEREQGQDPKNAFSYAVSQSLGAGGYFVSKPQMVEEYIKNKDWNADVASDRLLQQQRRSAEAAIDGFWRERLEATYQQDKARPQKQAILAAIWASVKDITDQLKAPASGINAGLFPDPGADLPGGWWWAKSAGAEYKAPEPYAPSHTPMWMQTVELSTVQGYVFKPYKGGGGAWCRPERNGKCDLPYQRVSITVSDWTMHGGEKPCTLSLQSQIKSFPALYTKLSDRAISSVGPEQNGIQFCLQNFHVALNDTAINGASPDPATTRHFANVIVRRINAQIKGQAKIGVE